MRDLALKVSEVRKTLDGQASNEAKLAVIVLNLEAYLDTSNPESAASLAISLKEALENVRK